MKYFYMGITVLLIGVMCFIPIRPGISLSDKQDETIAIFPWPDDTITIGWRHSVELTPWEETYHINKDGTLSFVKTVYQAYGAGTPDTEGEVAFLEDGFIEVSGIERNMPYFSLYYVPISRYFIKNNEATYYLTDFVPDYTAVQIHPQRVSLFDLLLCKLDMPF